jgi:hypothetical protein
LVAFQKAALAGVPVYAVDDPLLARIALARASISATPLFGGDRRPACPPNSGVALGSQTDRQTCLRAWKALHLGRADSVWVVGPKEREDA